MTDDKRPEEIEDEEEVAPTPFDNPWVLPVILTGGVFWFGYDGWINQDPNMLEHLTFNRYGAGVLLVLAVFFGWRAYQETQADKRAGDE